MKKLISLFLALFILLSFCGCDIGYTEADTSTNSDRFTVEIVYREGNSSRGIFILTDTNTGVQYLLYNNSNGSGLCKLEG